MNEWMNEKKISDIYTYLKSSWGEAGLKFKNLNVKMFDFHTWADVCDSSSPPPLQDFCFYFSGPKRSGSSRFSASVGSGESADRKTFHFTFWKLPCCSFCLFLNYLRSLSILTSVCLTLWLRKASAFRRQKNWVEAIKLHSFYFERLGNHLLIMLK